MSGLSDKIQAAHDGSDVAESAIIDQIKNAHEVTKDIEWPGIPDVTVRMRLLTVSESRKAKVDNQQEFKRDGIDIGVQNLADYREQEAVHGMWRAFSDPETGKPIFRSAEHMRSLCTNDELKSLCDAYNAFADENDPNLEKLSDEEFEQLKETLKKKTGPDSLESLKLACSLEASAYFGCPAKELNDAQWLLIFSMKGYLADNNEGWQTIGE